MAGGTRVVGSRLGPWVVVGRSWWPTKFAGQGLTSVPRRWPRRGTRRVHRGSWSIPLSLRREQVWVHIGDPASTDGHVIDAYQGVGGATAKMFLVRTPRGDRHRHVHALAPGERMNNSFAAVAPDGRWLVSGEWDTMRRLLVFPAPHLDARWRAPGTDLPLRATIELDRPVRNVQGATFLDPTTLLLACDDPGTDLWSVPRQLLEVRLAAPLDGTTVAAGVRCLGPLPTVSRCGGTFEVEGIDYDSTTGDLRVAVVPPQPCRLLTTVYRLRRVADTTPR